MVVLAAEGGRSALNTMELRTIPRCEIREARLELDFGGDPSSARGIRQNKVHLEAAVAPILGEDAVAERRVVRDGGLFGFVPSATAFAGRQGTDQGIRGNERARARGG